MCVALPSGVTKLLDSLELFFDLSFFVLRVFRSLFQDFLFVFLKFKCFWNALSYFLFQFCLKSLCLELLNFYILLIFISYILHSPHKNVQYVIFYVTAVANGSA